jgi:peroxiredoxin
MKTWIILAALAAGCGGGGKPGSTTVTASSDRGPPLTMVLPALDGGELELTSLRGKLVVLHVFTTWSLAAQAELESLATVDAADDVVVIGIALDLEGHALVAPWRNGAGVRYLITLGDDAVREGKSPLGKILSVPTTLVLDREGRVRERAERALAPGEIESLLAAARRE